MAIMYYPCPHLRAKEEVCPREASLRHYAFGGYSQVVAVYYQSLLRAVPKSTI